MPTSVRRRLPRHCRGSWPTPPRCPAVPVCWRGPCTPVALADSGLCLAHAMAQGLGGRYGLPQGMMNALCLPAALRFNAPAVPEAVERLGRALDGEAAQRCEELAALGDFGRLRVTVCRSPSWPPSRRRSQHARAHARTRGS